MKYLVLLICGFFSLSASFAHIYPLTVDQQKKFLTVCIAAKADKIEVDKFEQVQAFYSGDSLTQVLDKAFSSSPVNVQIRHALLDVEKNDKNTLLLIIEFNQSDALESFVGLIKLKGVGNDWKPLGALKFVKVIGNKGHSHLSEIKKLGPNKLGLIFEGSYEKAQETHTAVQLFAIEQNSLREMYQSDFITGNLGHCYPSLVAEPFSDKSPPNPDLQNKALPECYSHDIELNMLENEVHEGFYDIEISQKGTSLHKSGGVITASNQENLRYSTLDKKYRKVP